MVGERHEGIASAAQGARHPEQQRVVLDAVDIDSLATLIADLREREARSNAAAREIELGEFIVEGWRVPPDRIAALKSLSRTEVAVMRFLGWGRSNSDIASLLNIHENTVRTHLNNAIGKLEVDGSRGLACLAGLLFHPL
ncbi:MAG: LuxR C-terminal-related transcriptional regulator [Erythrobacter sp.]|jgi:DNA-binding NarL/FixJ family response regulator|nr:LuxR C-terminal-related transcriptional regulator [Erythrobacter sp.]